MRALVAALVLFAGAVHAETCTVVGIVDGDTLRAQCGAGTERVGLAAIDAPELRQPWGKWSRRHLSRLCLGKPAEVVTTTHDLYGRAVARVTCDGKDAAATMVRNGYAWQYTKYTKYSKDATLAALQDEARKARRGLWAGKKPIAPWLWRKARAGAGK